MPNINGYHKNKFYATALAWAKKEIALRTKQGWSKDEINHHVLAHVGREWNIGTEAFVRKSLVLEWPESAPEPEEDETSDDMD